ncbi:MAG TPA: phosphate ABC transporter substrate-binding protein [Planctomycetota bacterium]|nr:phosphate ABC transporter substrate-binding protein [Planctomycetota bacterium]
MRLGSGRKLLGVLVCSLLGAAPGQPAEDGATALDPGLKAYQPTPGLKGTLRSVGSDTLHPLMKAWAERFTSFHPDVHIDIEGKGSNTAPPSLIAGTSQLGPMSRALHASEIDAFEQKFGYKPRGIRSAVDSICVFVHKDNPLRALSLEQVDAIFSKTRLRGGKALRTWGDLGLSGDWADQPVRTYGRNSLSGTHVFFKDHALKGGEFREEIKELEGSAALVREVSEDRGGIGYCGVGYSAAGVRALPLSETSSSPAVEPTAVNAYAGDYPLSRILFVYFNQPPRRDQEPLVREFIRMVCSREGQELVLKEGYFPMPAVVAKEELAKAD